MFSMEQMDVEIFLNKKAFVMRTTGPAKRIQLHYTRRVPIPPEHKPFLWDEPVWDKCLM